MTDPILRLNAALEGRYRIERELGEGGMATVYLADDLRHERKVALKVLKPELAAVVGAERFLAEIKTTANLQHPHILPLFDSGEADSFLFYVMPYVEGESLRERLDREHQLPVEEAVQITTSVANALDYAHRHGVIHRDIKPANVLLHDGEPVLSDFGIALAVGVAGGGRLTETGLSLGTPHYMSPEQATGDQSVGATTDVYAVGCVLYEMLVGEPPYTGSTAQAILGKIIAGQPVSVSDQRKAVPPNVDAAIRKALEKLPADRFLSVGDLAKALSDPGFRVRPAVEATTAGSVGRGGVPASVFATLSLLLAGAAAWGWLRPQDSPQVSRLSVYVPTGHTLINGQFPTLAVSHDGNTLAFQTEGFLHLRSLNDFETERLPITGLTPLFSPDDEWVVSRTQMLRLRDGSVLQGTVGAWGASWGEDGTITYAVGIAGQSGLWRVSSEGGEARQLTSVKDESLETGHAWPQVLPDARGVLFTVLGPSGGWGDARIAVQEEGADEHRYIPVEQEATFARYLPTGHLLFTLEDGTVMAAPFDLDRLEPTGSPEPVLSGVRVASFGGAASWAVSDEGTIAFVLGRTDQEHVVLEVGRDGGVRRQLGDPLQGAWLDLSPDGSQVAMTTRTPVNNDIGVVDAVDGRLDRWSFASSEDETPIWSPDGRELAYSAAYTGQARHILRVGAPGGGQDTVFTATGHMHLTSWSPDGEWLLGYQADPSDPRTQNDVWLIKADGSEARPVLNTDNDEANATFSPDGAWVVFESDQTGQYELYVVSFPGFQNMRQITTNGGCCARWASEAGELVYGVPQSTTVRVMEYSLDGGFRSGAPRTLFDFTSRVVDLDVSLDGETFVVLTDNPEAPAREIRVIQNWFEELNRLVPVD